MRIFQRHTSHQNVHENHLHSVPRTDRLDCAESGSAQELECISELSGFGPLGPFECELRGPSLKLVGLRARDEVLHKKENKFKH